MLQTTFSFWRRLVGRGDGTSATAVENEERRLWVRYPANLATVVQPAQTPEPERISSIIRDISLGGANLVADRQFEPGQVITVELPLREGDETQSVLACVVRAVEEKPGQWALGCVFSRELAGEDLEGLGARRIRNRSSDKRVWMRFPTNVEATFQKVGDINNEASSARVLNISASGVGLLVNEKVETGALLSVELLGHGQVRRTILACVVHVSPREDSEWALGCNFIRELNEQDLKALI